MTSVANIRVRHPRIVLGHLQPAAPAAAPRIGSPQVIVPPPWFCRKARHASILCEPAAPLVQALGSHCTTARSTSWVSIPAHRMMYRARSSILTCSPWGRCTPRYRDMGFRGRSRNDFRGHDLNVFAGQLRARATRVVAAGETSVDASLSPNALRDDSQRGRTRSLVVLSLPQNDRLSGNPSGTGTPACYCDRACAFPRCQGVAEYRL